MATKQDLAALREEMATKRDLAALREETKQDLTALREETKQDLTALREETKQDLAAHREETKQDLVALETRLDVKIEARLAAQTAELRRHFEALAERVESSVRIVAEVNSHHATVLDNHEHRISTIEKRA